MALKGLDVLSVDLPYGDHPGCKIQRGPNERREKIREEPRITLPKEKGE